MGVELNAIDAFFLGAQSAVAPGLAQRGGSVTVKCPVLDGLIAVTTLREMFHE
jgi:hypothetical protein